jgi:ABC-type glutathione transport system ATPase component
MSTQTSTAATTTPVASARDVVVTYRTPGHRRGHGAGGGGGGRGESVRALSGVSLDIAAGQTVGVVGESGSGKTTLGRVLLGLVAPNSGQVSFRGVPLTGRGVLGRHSRRNKGRLQVVLQNPDWSLNPALHVWRSVAEPLAITGGAARRARRAAVEEMLTLVGLDNTLADRHPHELSGGQRQRVAIARAMITRPDLIVFDEAVTALDVSVQTQILNLIRDLQAERGFAALFISHDIAAVRYVAHQIAVVHQGQIVESGPVERFYGQPEHPYTRQLLGALPAVTQAGRATEEHPPEQP